MQILSRDSLPLGGFAGLTEHRLVTDSKVFGGRKAPNTFEGIGTFVYLADAQFNPFGETHMHPHKEIDVISIMLDGRVSHEGSLEHGQSLNAGEAQVQRAGGEGFSHNEVNPDETKNRMLQLWVLPEVPGEPAGYKHYALKQHGSTRIYGGTKEQSDTFDSKTTIDVVRLGKSDVIELTGESLIYVSKGAVEVIEGDSSSSLNEGDIVRSVNTTISTNESAEVVIIKA